VPTSSLSVELAGTGSGTVASSPAGIDCGFDCSASFPAGTEVILTATAAFDSYFVEWSGTDCVGTDSCSVDLSTSRFVQATFQLCEQPPCQPISDF
jgi:hypothetical protein